MEEWPQMAPNRVRRIFFLLIQTLPTFWAEWILILRIFIFFIFWIPNFWISRFPDISNLAWVGPQHSTATKPGPTQARFEISGNLEIQIGSR